MSARGNENLLAKHRLNKVSSLFCGRANFGTKFTATEGPNITEWYLVRNQLRLQGPSQDYGPGNEVGKKRAPSKMPFLREHASDIINTYQFLAC